MKSCGREREFSNVAIGQPPSVDRRQRITEEKPKRYKHYFCRRPRPGLSRGIQNDDDVRFGDLTSYEFYQQHSIGALKTGMKCKTGVCSSDLFQSREVTVYSILEDGSGILISQSP